MNPTSHDIDILARTLYGEARARDEQDALAIAHVVLNRVSYPNWPDSISAVCLQPYQFSCFNVSDPNRQRVMSVIKGENQWFDRCLEIAQEVASSKKPDPTFKSTHYHTPAVSPNWSRGKKPAYQTEGHLFFNDIDTPPPSSSREALEQERPLEKTRTVRAGKAGSAIGGVAVVSGAIAAIGPAVPVLRDIAEVARDNAPGLLVAFGLASLIAIGAMVYARLDDRRKGRR